MFFIDSWVWIELFSEDEKYKEAEKVIEKLQKKEGVISSTVLMEVRYRIKKKYNRELSDRVIHIMEAFDNLNTLPVTSEVAKYAADLRDKYYERKKKELSYADAIHLATAVLADCEILYSGDRDFEDIKEIKTVII